MLTTTIANYNTDEKLPAISSEGKLSDIKSQLLQCRMWTAPANCGNKLYVRVATLLGACLANSGSDDDSDY